MAANKVIRFGPAYISNSIANILNCTVTSFAGPVGIIPTIAALYLIIRHIRIVNKTASAATCILYIDATGGSTAGKEFLGGTLSIAAYSPYDWYGMLRLDAADFLTGIAGTASALVIQGEGEVGVL
jgi:hypothetical protein